MTDILRTKPWDVEHRLQELGLSTAGLHEVGRAAYRARANCSPLHPPTFPGTAGWAAGVFTLRDKYLPQGWRFADPGNFSMTINDKRGIYIVVATGDENSGRPIGKTPTTKTPKGMKTEAAVRRQGEFWPDAVPKEEEAELGVDKFTAYWLLLNFSERSLLIELSSPSDIEGGKITAWHERIILPPIDFDTSGKLVADGPSGGFAPDAEVPVERIG
jgi:hypothetical protein